MRRYSNQASYLMRLEPLLRIGDKQPHSHPEPEGPGKETRGHARRLRPSDINEMVTTYQNGATVHELAKRFGIHRATVGKHLRARGIDTTPPGIAPADIPTAIKLYESGWSLARVAERFGTTANTVHARLREAGVRMRDRQGRER